MVGVVSFLNFRTFLTIFVAGFTINFASAGLLVFFWIQILHLPYPIPLVGFTSKTLLFSIVIVVCWFQFPISWRRNSQFKQKAKHLLLAHIFIYIMDTERFFYLWLFHVVPQDFQWILAPMLVLLREINAMILTKICKNIGGNEDGSVELIITHLGIEKPSKIKERAYLQIHLSSFFFLGGMGG